MKQSLKAMLSLVLALTVMMTCVVFGGAKELYIISDVYLTVGDNNCTMDSSADYMAFAFSPEDVGEYTFSVDSGKIGIVSYTDMWVQNDPSEENVNATSVEWECTAVGQGIYVAVKSTESSVTVNVKRKELIVEEEVPWTVYENKHTPAPFAYSGVFGDMEYVDTFDSVADEAILGDDGFYHLNSVDGPILYACLNDSVTLNLQDANSYGQLKEVLTDENGKIYERTDFYDAFEAYFACADRSCGLYPLTEDLIAMFTRVGTYHGWYGADGFIGGELTDAWMFACYYTEEDTIVTFPTGDEATTTTQEGATSTTATPTGRPMPSAPPTETTISGETTETTVATESTDTTSSDTGTETTGTQATGETGVTETDTTTPNGDANTTDASGETSTTVSSDATTTVPDAQANTTAPNGDANATVSRDVATTTLNNATDTTLPNGETNTTAPNDTDTANTTVDPENGDTTTAPEGGATTVPVTDGTTAADGSANTTATPDGATTTTNQVQNVGGDSAPTGDVSNAALVMMIAVAAAVVMVATSKKVTSK